MKINQDLSLYIHIPFCVKKCLYCDFLSGPADESTREAYVQALLVEIESYRENELSKRPVKSVFFGGGTPSLLEVSELEKILNKIKSVFLLEKDCEITMEMNPGTVDGEKAKGFFEIGVNRASVGLQSTDNQLLFKLGRIHTFEDFLETYRTLRKAGFRNINVDVMSALPGQTVSGYSEGLEKVMALEPEHISAYSLIIEEGTPFYDTYHNASDLLPGEEADREMYEETLRLLSEKGYMRYEISNYAKPGYESRHNTVYWERGDYLGLGLGSASLIDEVRFKNTCDLKGYIEGWLTNSNESLQGLDREELDEEARMEEFMFLGLRMMKGISEEKFENQFGKNIYEVYGTQIEELLYQNLIEKYTGLFGENKEPGTWICLTSKGIDLSNYVFRQFLF